MPRYYFDLRYDSGSWSPDQDGVDLAGPDDARCEALDLLGAKVKELVRHHWQFAVRVRDDQAEPVLTLILSLRAQERS